MGLFCWLIRRRLDAFHDGELGSQARLRLEGHLAGCPGCSAESASLTRLHAALAAPAPEPPEAVWETFWPQVRTRLAATPAPEPSWWGTWSLAPGRPRFVLGSALAAAALAVIAILAPWQGLERHVPRMISGAPVQVASVPAGAAALGSAAPQVPQVPQVMVHSVETADPESSVMVYTNAESDMTVVWVFGLARTDT
jgi:anti-sigma factor RsiW